MRKLTYLAVLEPSDTGYSVFFPDVLGCISGGSDMLEAQEMAKEALGLHIYGMEKDGDDIPEPSGSVSLSEFECEPGSVIAPITIHPDMVRNELDNKRIKTNVTIPAWLKELAEENNVSYSRLLESALLEYLDVKERHTA